MSAAEAGPVPVYFLHVDDFEWWLGMLEPDASVAEGATELGRHVIGARVPDQGLPLSLTLIQDTGDERGVLLDPSARVGDLIAPLSLLKLAWRQG